MKKITKFIKKILNKIGITPYVYYVYKHNNPMAIKERLFGNNEITIFDVGANDGQTIKLYKKHFPKSNIFSFEPTPNTFEKLVRKSSKYTNVNFYNEALTDYVGVTEFHLNHSSLTNSILKSTDEKHSSTDVYNTIGKITVNTNTIDNFCIENKIDKINILKTDAQGADLKILMGASEMLKAKKIDLIYVEVEFVQLYENQPLYHDISSFLNKYSYNLFSLYNISVNEKGQMIYGDAIFIKK